MKEFTATMRRTVGSGKSKKEITREVLIMSSDIKSAYDVARRSRGKNWELKKEDIHQIVIEPVEAERALEVDKDA